MNSTLEAMKRQLLASPSDDASLHAMADLLGECDPADRLEVLTDLFRRASGAGLRGPGMAIEQSIPPSMSEAAVRHSMRQRLGAELISTLLECPTAQVSATERERFEVSGYTNSPHRIVRLELTIRPLTNAPSGPVPVTYFHEDPS